MVTRWQMRTSTDADEMAKIIARLRIIKRIVEYNFSEATDGIRTPDAKQTGVTARARILGVLENEIDAAEDLFFEKYVFDRILEAAIQEPESKSANGFKRLRDI